uniref:ORF271 n=1 Tax=Leptospirillum ferrooxidans TaxID=180 RepID=Q58KC0_9BACT|nr:ORF271 [Leptospirillum ferrooxidans]
MQCPGEELRSYGTTGASGAEIFDDCRVASKHRKAGGRRLHGRPSDVVAKMGHAYSEKRGATGLHRAADAGSRWGAEEMVQGQGPPFEYDEKALSPGRIPGGEGEGDGGGCREAAGGTCGGTRPHPEPLGRSQRGMGKAAFGNSFAGGLGPGGGRVPATSGGAGAWHSGRPWGFLPPAPGLERPVQRSCPRTGRAACVCWPEVKRGDDRDPPLNTSRAFLPVGLYATFSPGDSRTRARWVKEKGLVDDQGTPIPVRPRGGQRDLGEDFGPSR